MHHTTRLLLALLLLSASSAGSAQTASQPAITPDIVYGHKDGMALIYDMFEPQGQKNGAGILFMVSGGWFSVWAEPQSRVAGFSSFLEAGYTVFAVHHGSAPRYKVPEAYEDVDLALRHIRLNAQEYGIDPERLGVTGGSAGGHLSLMLGLHEPPASPSGTGLLQQRSDVAAVVAYFPRWTCGR